MLYFFIVKGVIDMKLEFLDNLDIELELPRGDQFPISFKIVDDEGNYFDEEEIDDIVVTCRKYPVEECEVLFQKRLGKEIEYDGDHWTMLLSTDDTKELEYGLYGYEIKIFADNIIKTFVGHINIKDEYTGELE